MKSPRFSTRIRLVVKLLLGVILVLLIWMGMRPAAVEIDVADTVRGVLEVTVNEDGETRIRDPYLISAPLAGRLLRVEWEPGDVISEGQIIAAIDDHIVALAAKECIAPAAANQSIIPQAAGKLIVAP